MRRKKIAQQRFTDGLKGCFTDKNTMDDEPRPWCSKMWPEGKKY